MSAVPEAVPAFLAQVWEFDMGRMGRQCVCEHVGLSVLGAKTKADTCRWGTIRLLSCIMPRILQTDFILHMFFVRSHFYVNMYEEMDLAQK